MTSQDQDKGAVVCNKTASFRVSEETTGCQARRHGAGLGLCPPPGQVALNNPLHTLPAFPERPSQ